MHIRRDQSHLRFGRFAGRRGGWTLRIIWAVIMLALLGVIWRFNAVQDWALAGLGMDPTVTPNAISHAVQANTPIWRAICPRPSPLTDKPTRSNRAISISHLSTDAC
ncbi:MAG: hypothetical protein K8S97_14815 [Anaerolineae bacterium]|nr:hypothetical protein [Anaerolineae bacterium]